MLSSEILEQQFGDTHIIVLKQNDKHRIIKTTGYDGTILELSLVTFAEKTPSFPAVHSQVIDGLSMGKAYSQSNIPFVRKVNSVSASSLPLKLQSYFENQSKDVTIVDVDILVGKDNDYYCHILEIYSPAVNWPQPPGGNTLPGVVKALNKFSELV